MNDTGDLETAFARAGEARSAIALVVDEVASGAIDLATAFQRGDADALVGRVFAVKVFESVPGIGKVRARRTMGSVGLPEGVWLSEVSESHRAQISAAFAAPAA